MVGGAVGVVVVLAVAFVGIRMIKGGGGEVTGPVKAGQCVDIAFGIPQPDEAWDYGDTVATSNRVDCDDEKAKAKVLKVTQERESPFALRVRNEPECPKGADGVTDVKIAESSDTVRACVRNLKSPHPGDPGAGGGLVGPGDCVSDGPMSKGHERPCSGSKWYGKVIARADSEEGCPAGTMETLDARTSRHDRIPRPIFCLGAGGGVVSPGTCIEDPSYLYGMPRTVDCSSSLAVGQVVARTKTTDECPSEATHEFTAEGRYLPVLCVKRFRPTETEIRLRPLN